MNITGKALRKEISTITGIKELKIEDNKYLYFWYANNKGRGENNCTIILSRSHKRMTTSRKQTEIITTIKTSAWKGRPNFSNYIFNKLFNKDV